MAKNASLGQLEDMLELYLVKKAPFQLPASAKELIVKVMPWATLIIMILALPVVLLALGLGAFAGILTGVLGPFAAVSYAQGLTFSVVVLLVSVVLELIAIPGLFAKSVKGWRFVYWATLVSLVSSLMSFQIVSGLVGALISLYILFQVKSYYR